MTITTAPINAVVKCQDPTIAENEQQGQQLAIDTAAVIKERRIKRQDPTTITDNEQQGQEPVKRHSTATTEKDFEMNPSEEEEDEEPYEFPESTFTFLITENVFSAGFVTAIMTQILSLTCLFLAFKNQMSSGA
jgi:hypothetical protein